MKDFYKEFPSLKGKVHFITGFKVGEIPEDNIITRDGEHKIKLKQEPHTFEGKTINIIGDSCRVYNKEHIQEHCLDKERVREVIDKLSIHNLNTCFEKFKCVTCQLKKELGLKG